MTGELVFSTSMTEYTEVLTDSSYYGQIIVFANPEIGNYGVSAEDFQSRSIKVKALVVRNLSFFASSHRAEMTLVDWLLREQIPVIFGIDTRALITHIRQTGAMMAALSANQNLSVTELVNTAKSLPPMGALGYQKMFLSVGPKKWRRIVWQAMEAFTLLFWISE